MTIICGVEEAGRGPVIGPLVMCALTIDKEDEQKLVEMGVKDSKLLSPRQREDLFPKVLEMAKDHRVLIVSPQEIDDVLLGEDSNLNWLEADTSVKMLNELEADEAILDCPSTNVEAYTEYVKKKITSGMKIKCEHKADLNYPVVSAASIIAKVTRDKEIEKIKEHVGTEMIGSGYPADPITVRFLKENWDKHPEIFRKSWKTYQKVAQEKNQSKLDKF